MLKRIKNWWIGRKRLQAHLDGTRVVRLFQIGECDTVMAHTADEAKKFYVDIVGKEELDRIIEDGEFRLIPDAELDALYVFDTEEHEKGIEKNYTYREYLRECLLNNDQVPNFFCSSEWQYDRESQW